MNILISGVTGYLGCNINDYLSLNHQISVLNKEYCINNPKNGYDVFLYFSNPNEINFHNNEYQSIIDMINNFYSIIDVLQKNRIKHILYASTMRIHDEKKNVYASTHLFVENLLENFSINNDIYLSKIRFGNIFGGNISSILKRNTLVPHVFIKQAIENHKITLFTNGMQYRDFTPISVVKKYVDYILVKKPQEIDVCTGNNFKVLDVAKIIKSIFPSIDIHTSNKSLNENKKEYKSILSVSRDDVIKEIVNLAYDLKNNYDKNIK